MKLAGMTVVGHDELQLELHCFSAMIAGTSAPAIDAIDLSRTLEEEAEYEKREFDRVQPGLRGFGLANVQLWTHSKKFQTKPVLSQLAHAKLHREEWWDARVELVMNSFSLTTDEIRMLHNVFVELDYTACGMVETQVWFESLDEPVGVVTEYQKWILRVCETDDVAHVSFGEYLECVCTYCMFEKVETTRFIFGTMDDEKRSYIDERKYSQMCRHLMEYNPIPCPQAKLDALFPLFCDKNEELFFDQFLELMDSFPPFLFPMLRLQERLQNANGGVKFWKAKKKLFQNARGRLQMNRI